MPIIIILIEIWFDSSRNWGDETILFAIDARNGYPNNKSQRSSSILAHSSLKKKKEIEISIESKIIYDEEKNIENVFDTYRKFYKDLRKREYCFL